MPLRWLADDLLGAGLFKALQMTRRFVLSGYYYHGIQVAEESDRRAQSTRRDLYRAAVVDHLHRTEESWP